MLRGPGPTLDNISRSFIPPGLDFDLSVPVSEDGVADLSLRGYSGQLTPEASELMITQLVWTLSQEPTIEAIRVSIGGQQITSATGQSLFSVDEASVYDPTGLDSSSLFYGLRDGLMVSGQPDALAPVTGPMGTSEIGVRSLAVDLDATTVAAISSDGHQALDGLGRRPATARRGGRPQRRQPAPAGLGPRRPAVARGRDLRRRGGDLRRGRQRPASSRCPG